MAEFNRDKLWRRAFNLVNSGYKFRVTTEEDVKPGAKLGMICFRYSDAHSRDRSVALNDHVMPDIRVVPELFVTEIVLDDDLVRKSKVKGRDETIRYKAGGQSCFTDLLCFTSATDSTELSGPFPVTLYLAYRDGHYPT